MQAIAAVDENWALGKDGRLLVHLPGDLKYYKQRTLGRHIVIGRKTLDSFPGGRPLPGRDNIVLTGRADFAREGCRVCHSLEELEAMTQALASEDVIVSGGASVYRQLMQQIDVFYITHILRCFPGADAHLENLAGMKDMQMTWRSELQEENGTRYYFARYERYK
ncbi:MAG: dihydrofolate reductase [Eubacteriales bacterium]|nr:dihydrofolate reductase [Eubacteriales bacterium]